MSDYVHIVSFDAPSPPDYGGAIDVYYKIVALSGIGKKVILHYFDYNKNRNTDGLEKYCYALHRYDRKSFLTSTSLHIPYIVSSRVNQELVKRLNEDNYPIILEGVHCTGILKFISREKRKVVLRLHNDEHKYYSSLAKAERNLAKSIYYRLESRILKYYQTKLPRDISIAALSTLDLNHFGTQFPPENLHFVPSFVPWQSISTKPGIGDYCLYHGNMSVSENERAAEWLVTSVFSKVAFPLVIAGKEISEHLKRIAKGANNVKLISNPSNEALLALIQGAHINILPSLNNTGVKLKVLNALYNGRFCLTNSNAIEGSELMQIVHIMDNPDEFIQKSNDLLKMSFTEEDVLKRSRVLTIYNNMQNAEKLNALIL